jgi:hypothetical protein
VRSRRRYLPVENRPAIQVNTRRWVGSCSVSPREDFGLSRLKSNQLLKATQSFLPTQAKLASLNIIDMTAPKPISLNFLAACYKFMRILVAMTILPRFNLRVFGCFVKQSRILHSLSQAATFRAAFFFGQLMSRMGH